MARIKICGINSEAAFDTCVDAGVDWVGFVFYPPSPRHLTPDQAAALSARSDGGPKRVGLFVRPTDEQIATTLNVTNLDVLQVYDEPRRVAAIGAFFCKTVWRGFGVASVDDLPRQSDGADGFLLDAPASSGGLPGGNARTFDWSLLRAWRSPVPWLLAGGLTPQNVAEALAISGAPGVDVSSGVETAPGRKAPAFIRAFVDAAKPL
jgi:phosphoribosylanthranilate isomerase